MKVIPFLYRTIFYGGTSKFALNKPEWAGGVAVKSDIDPAEGDYHKLNILLTDHCPHGSLVFGGMLSKKQLEEIEKDNSLIDINWNDYTIYTFSTTYDSDTREYWTSDRVVEETNKLQQGILKLIKE